MRHYLREYFCGINCQIILRKQGPLYISKIKFGNGEGGHVLVASALKFPTFKKCTYIKNVLIRCNIFRFLAIIIDISIIISFFLKFIY